MQAVHITSQGSSIGKPGAAKPNVIVLQKPAGPGLSKSISLSQTGKVGKTQYNFQYEFVLPNTLSNFDLTVFLMIKNSHTNTLLWYLFFLNIVDK